MAEAECRLRSFGDTMRNRRMFTWAVVDCHSLAVVELDGAAGDPSAVVRQTVVAPPRPPRGENLMALRGSRGRGRVPSTLVGDTMRTRRMFPWAVVDCNSLAVVELDVRFAPRRRFAGGPKAVGGWWSEDSGRLVGRRRLLWAVVRQVRVVAPSGSG